MMDITRLLVIYILMWVLPCSINGATDQSDVSALNVMFSSMNSPPQLTGWTASAGDPCGESWKGIECSGSKVTKIDISGLGLSGSLGYQLGSMTSVTEFDISNNNIGEAVPYNFPPNLEKLNIGRNNFNGVVPFSISQMSKLQNLNLSHNHINQQLGDMFQQLSSLTILDLSYNNIPGNLPASFSSLTSLNSLYLQNNQFTGTIDVLGNLPLDNLNVANNHFTGWIPPQLQNINIQKDGNSWNSGPAPPPPPGTPPAEPHHKPGEHGDSHGRKSGISSGAVAGIVISILLVGAVVAFFLVKRKRSRRSATDIEKVESQPFTPLASNDVHVYECGHAEAKSTQISSSFDSKTTSLTTKTFETPATLNLKPPPSDIHKSFDLDEGSNKSLNVPLPVIMKKVIPIPGNVKSYSIADLQVATGSFDMENLIEEGSIGRVFRAELDNGKVLAVKKINPSALENSSEDFTEVVANVSRLHHENVTELVGYCSEHGQHLLVYEFHKNGSLHDFLHLVDEYSKPLTWNCRVKIALGSARALEYLHEVCSPSVVHKNFKSENILLDGELNPHVSDCGLASLYPAADQAMNHNACAPEVADSGQYTLQSDVYSFGVVMLELLTGRKPFDSSRSRTEQSLVRWATPQLHDIDALTKMVDPALEDLYPVKSLSRFADVIALCVQPEPEFRPPMSEVVQALVRLVQRTNMSKRTVGNASRQSENSDTTVSSLS